MLPRRRIKVECGRIRHIAAGIVGDDRNVIADLVLHGIAFERSKRVAYRDIRRPRHAPVRAPRVE